MALLVDITPDFSFTDDRGTLTQLVSGGYNQINSIFTRAGAIRGRFHYHKRNKEVFFVISGKVRVRAEKDGEEEERVFTGGDFFLVNEYVRHDFLYLEDTYMIGMYSDCVENEDGTKDIYE